MKIAIGIATAGRREQLALTLEQLAYQSTAPHRVLVCPASPDDFDESSLPDLGAPVVRVTGPRGLCAQRNAILAQARDCDVILFIDDDFYPAPDYVACLAGIFTDHPDIAIVTTHPEHDGAAGPGLTHEFAIGALSTRQAPSAELSGGLSETYGGYGCNFGVRLSLVFAHAIHFDENLPLYGWLEDIDFSRRLAPFGRVMASRQLYGVHLGTKRGKSSGVRLGYSQVANPVYMIRKGSMTLSYGLQQVLKNVSKNVARMLVAEPWVDRRGRAKGNIIALCDLVLGRVDPRRILEL